MSAIDEHFSELVRMIALANRDMMADIEKLREMHKDWTRLDLEIRVRWAKYTLEVADLEREKLHVMRTLEQVANVGTPEAHQSLHG